MSKMIRTLMLVVLLTGMVGQIGFAVEVPANAKKDPVLSAAALDSAKEVFAKQKAALTAQSESDDSALPEDQKAFIDSLLVRTEQELEALVSIEVYFVEENTPGEAYDDTVAFYQSTLKNFMSVESDELAMMLDAPVEIMPEAAKEALRQMVEDGSARAAGGTSESSRVSIMTFYINPNTSELIRQTTIVVAKTK